MCVHDLIKAIHVWMAVVSLLFLRTSVSQAQQLGAEIRFGNLRPEGDRPSMWATAVGIYVSKTYHPCVSVRAALLSAASAEILNGTGTLGSWERTTALYICPALQISRKHYVSAGAGILRHHGPLRQEAETRDHVHHSTVMVVEAGRQFGRCQIGARYTWPIWNTGMVVGHGVDLGICIPIHQPYRDLPTRRKWRRALLPWNAVMD